MNDLPALITAVTALVTAVTGMVALFLHKRTPADSAHPPVAPVISLPSAASTGNPTTAIAEAPPPTPPAS